MKKDEAFQTVSLHCRCNYTHFVIGYYNAILSCHFYRYYQTYKHLSYPYIIEGELRKKGLKFMLRRPDLNILLFYELKELTVTDYYSIIKYNIYKTIPKSMEYIHQIEIRYINEDECQVISSFIYNNKIYFSEKDFQMIIRSLKDTYRCIECSLREFTVLKLSTAYTVINSNIELIWDIIRNLKMVHKYIHLLSDNIIYDGKIIKKDTIIQLINQKGKKPFKSIAKINKCKMIKNELTKESIIEILFQNNNGFINPKLFSEKQIVIRIYEFENKCTLYILYFFNNTYNYHVLESFTKAKNKELKKLKYIIENYKKKISKII
jgi:hypothetical protein